MSDDNKILLDYRASLDQPDSVKIILDELKRQFDEFQDNKPDRSLGVRVVVTDYGEKT